MNQSKKFALVSVSDKTNIINFCKKLNKLNYTIISTGNSYKILKQEGVDVIYISDVTNFPEILDGRVKTLHPNIHAGLLADVKNPEHRKTLEKLKISPIEIVVVNLYDFEGTMKSTLDHEKIIENIDIGGPTMLRSAAKNFANVLVITDVEDYDWVIHKLEANLIALEDRHYLAMKVFKKLAHYNSLIGQYFSTLLPKDKSDYKYETIPLKLDSQLRYGENSHQKAELYKLSSNKPSLLDFKQLHGKELSFNNYLDIDSAIALLAEFERPTVIGIKHTNSCCVASDDDINVAFQKSYEGDPISIFGGIFAINREVTKEIADKISKIFIEIVIATGFEAEAFKILSQKKNIRLLEIKNLDIKQTQILRQINGGFLKQENDIVDHYEEAKNAELVSGKAFGDYDDISFGIKIMKHLKSNAICITYGQQLLGIGTGQTSRILACDQAIKSAKEKNIDLSKTTLFSDAFFPFPDSLESIKKAGICNVVQPGGSINDNKVIEYAKENGINMLFTKIRHFKH